jgi:hypothetical protein
VNQIEIAYSYGRSDNSLDTSIVIANARLGLNAGTIDFTHYFDLAHRMAWAKAGVPIASVNGSIGGTRIQSSVTGTGDSGYEIGLLLKGGEALSVEQFENYKPTKTLGVSLGVTAPTGTYRPDKILNLGSARWAFRPEIGFSNPFGQKWQFDCYANADFFTGNTSYRGREILRQDPLPGLEGHLSYAFHEKAWASVDARYSSRGETSLNGAGQNDEQQNLTLGSELNVSFSQQSSVVFSFAEFVVHKNGPAYTGLTVKYSYTWGKGYK